MVSSIKGQITHEREGLNMTGLNKFEKIIVKLTHRLWNRRISSLLIQAYERKIITSEQLHILCSWFDPTQDHKVY